MRRQAQERRWQLAAASYPHLDGAPARQRMWSSLDEAVRHLSKRESVFEVVDDETRIQMIGQALKLHRRKSKRGDYFWADVHKGEIEWLRSQGITPEEAIRRHEAWAAKEMQHPFWKPAKKRDRKAKRRWRTARRSP